MVGSFVPCSSILLSVSAAAIAAAAPYQGYASVLRNLGSWKFILLAGWLAAIAVGEGRAAGRPAQVEANQGTLT